MGVTEELVAQTAPHQSGRGHKKKGGRGRPPKGPSGGTRNPEVNWHGQKRSNQTHQSTTDPEERLARKSNNTAAN